MGWIRRCGAPPCYGYTTADCHVQILTFNADNASNNDTQTDTLDDLPNSFEHVNRVRCFNHTMQISARGLLEPLTTAKPANEGIDVDDNDMAGVNNPDDTIASDDEDENADGVDEIDDDADLMDGLDEDEKEDLIESTKEAAEALQKVCSPAKYGDGC